MASVAPACSSYVLGRSSSEHEEPSQKEEDGGSFRHQVRLALEEENPDTRLYAATWSGTCIASTAGGLFLFAGLLLLGLGERQGSRLGTEGGPSVILLCRVLSFFCFHVIPGRLCTGNGVAFSLYGLSPKGGPCSQLLLPSLTPGSMARYARSFGRAGWEVRRAMATSLLFDAIPSAFSLALIVIPLGGEQQHFGLIVLAIANILSRLLVANRFQRLMPPPPGALEYFQSMQKRIGHSNVLFLVMGAVFSIAQSYTGAWLCTLTPLLLFLYELIGVVGVQTSFTQSFVMSSAARASFSGTGQGLMPSMISCITHCNAESARLALLICTFSSQDDVSYLISTVLLTLVWNVLVRTRYSQRGFHILSGGKWCNSNTLSLLLKIKFQMGYPRFFALAAVVLARLALGSSPLPSAFTLLCPVLLFVEEVLEDVVVALAERLGLCSHVPYAPRPVEAELARRAAKLAKLPQESPGSGSKLCCAGRGRQAEVTSFDTIAPETAAADIMRAHKFNFDPQEITLQMPLWSHFCSLYPGQTNLVLCLIFFGGGVPHLLGLCDEPGYRGAGRGLLWWPYVDPSQPCD